MIIPNATLEVKQKTAGRIDPLTGYPVKATSAEWGDPIPCQVLVSHYNAMATNNGEHVTSSAYSVLIDEQEFNAEQIRLTDENGKSLGEFSVKQVEPLPAVGQVRIWV